MTLGASVQRSEYYLVVIIKIYISKKDSQLQEPFQYFKLKILPFPFPASDHNP